jgi:hypothetical protein
MLPAPVSFVSRKGALGAYEVTGWKYVEDTAWHVKVFGKSRFPFTKAYVVQDGAFRPETTPPAEKVAILQLIEQWEAGLSDAETDFLEIINPD